MKTTAQICNLTLAALSGAWCLWMVRFFRISMPASLVLLALPVLWLMAALFLFRQVPWAWWSSLSFTLLGAFGAMLALVSPFVILFPHPLFAAGAAFYPFLLWLLLDARADLIKRKAENRG